MSQKWLVEKKKKKWFDRCELVRLERENTWSKWRKKLMGEIQNN